MRLPISVDGEGIEVGLAGVPFDLGNTFRTGQRQGPAQVREMSRLIRPVNGSTDIAPTELCRIADVGDAPVDPLSLRNNVDLITSFFSELHKKNVRPLACGGDHTITYFILRAIAQDRPLGLLHIDSHFDTREQVNGERVNNATLLRRAVEENLIDPKRTVQVGLRGTRPGHSDKDFSIQSGMRVITYDDYEEMGRLAVIEEVRRVLGDQPAYITFDVDSLDPVYCPGTGVWEPGGLSMRDSQVLLRGLRGLNVVAGDVVEVCPSLDPSGLTAANAANLMFEILCLMSENLASERPRGKASKLANALQLKPTELHGR